MQLAYLKEKSLHGLLEIQKNFITLTQYLDLIGSFSKSQIEGREEVRKVKKSTEQSSN